jgi:hypothetical protein
MGKHGGMEHVLFGGQPSLRIRRCNQKSSLFLRLKKSRPKQESRIKAAGTQPLNTGAFSSVVHLKGFLGVVNVE